MSESRNRHALTQLRAMIDAGDYPLNSRLPPERTLCETMGVSRTALRKALAALEAEGQIWRHVGKGTFVGSAPFGMTDDLAAITSRTNPAEVMQARLMLEPELARLAALNATQAHVEEMRRCIRRTKAAREWRGYEAWDTRLHRTIALAGGNGCTLALFDMLNGIRRTVAWGRLRSYELGGGRAHHSFEEHDALVDAIEHRDTELAASVMRDHLRAVRRDLLQSMPDSD